MEKLTREQIIELAKIGHEADSTADMIDGCKNRMRTCNTTEELDQLYISLMRHANKLYEQARRRLYVKSTPDFDAPLQIKL